MIAGPDKPPIEEPASELVGERDEERFHDLERSDVGVPAVTVSDGHIVRTIW